MTLMLATQDAEAAGVPQSDSGSGEELVDEEVRHASQRHGKQSRGAASEISPAPRPLVNPASIAGITVTAWL